MFERYTDRARRVIVLAQEEARMLSHNFIGTEHLLLGLIHEGDGVAAQALTALDISLEAVRSQVEEIIGQGNETPAGHIPFTPRAKKVIELSLREALQLGHNYIGTEHVLLGLIREGEGVAAQVLVKLGAELTTVRRQVIEILTNYQGKLVESGGGFFGGTYVQRLLLRDLSELNSKIQEAERNLAKYRAQRVEVTAALQKQSSSVPVPNVENMVTDLNKPDDPGVEHPAAS